MLNTSFNNAGELLIEDPVDAIISAIKTNLHYVLLENKLINLKKVQASHKKISFKKIRIYKILQIKKNESKAIKIITNKFSNKELKKKIIIHNKYAQTLSKRVFEKTKEYLKRVIKIIN